MRSFTFFGVLKVTANGIADCPLCGGKYRFEVRREPEAWRCSSCTKNQWQSAELFKEIMTQMPAGPIAITGPGKSTNMIECYLQVHNQLLPRLSSGPTDTTIASKTMSCTLENYITSDEKVDPALESLKSEPVWYFDIETFSDELARTPKEKPATDPFRNKVRLITIGNSQVAFTFDVIAITDPMPIIRAIREKYVVGNNLKFDLKTLAVKYGREYLPKRIFDTMLMATLLHRAREIGIIKPGTLSLKGVLERYLNVIVSKEEQASDWSAPVLREEQIRYALTDVTCLSALTAKLVTELNGLVTGARERTEPDKLGLVNKVARLENDCLMPLIRAELNGIPINPAIFDDKLQMQEKVATLEARFITNYALKPSQVAKVRQMLEDDFDLRLDDMKKTTLERFRSVVPVAEVLDYRTAVSGLKFLDRVEKLLRDGKLYTSFSQISAPSGRMSTRPSVQSIPRNLKKKIYMPPDGWKIIRGDFPAIELRLVAIKAGEDNLIEAFRQGKDPHRMTASELSGKPESMIDDDDIERKTAKACNFGFLYGMSAETFQIYAMPIIGKLLSKEEAEKFQNGFFRAYPQLNRWQQETSYKLRRLGGQGVVSTLYGRKVKVGKLPLALNVTGQGSGADLIKDALKRFDKAIIEVGLSAKIINIIHDEIIAIAPDDEIEQVKELLRTAMESAADDMIGLFHTPVEPVVFGRNGVKEG